MPDVTEEDMGVLEWEVYYIIYMHQENFPLRVCFVPYNLKICGLLQQSVLLKSLLFLSQHLI